jgi:hypothetical protein
VHGEVLCGSLLRRCLAAVLVSRSQNNLCSANCKLPRNLEANTAVAGNADESASLNSAHLESRMQSPPAFSQACA